MTSLLLEDDLDEVYQGSPACAAALPRPRYLDNEDMMVPEDRGHAFV
jgi:hypothetical protein